VSDYCLFVDSRITYYKADKIAARDHTPQDHIIISADFLSA